MKYKHRDVRVSTACYAAIGVGHDALLLERHAYGLIDEDLPNDNEEDNIGDIKDPGSTQSSMSWNDRDVDEEDKDKDKQDEQDDKDKDNEGRDSGDKASNDSDFDAYF